MGNSDSVPNNISSKSFESDAIQMVFSSPSSHDENLGSATTYSLLLPGHKKDIIKKTRGRKELFSKEIEGTVSLTFLLDLMKRTIMYYVSNRTKRENDFQMIHQYHSIKITSQCFLNWRVKCRISSLSL